MAVLPPWPSAYKAHRPTLPWVLPPDHIRAATERSLQHLGIGTIDLQQFHVWSDAWAPDEGWRRAVSDLKREGLIRGFGISANRWEPANVLAALETGLVDSVQVVYNIFDQAPEDTLFPACERLDVAVIARVEALRPLVPDGWTLPDLALRFILQHRAVSTTIPGMRRTAHVDANARASDGQRLPEALMARLRPHRWDRTHVVA